MRKSMLVLNSVVGATLLTAVAVAGTLLYLMFSTDDAVAHKTGMFGALFFSTTRIADGGLGITMGVANPVPLLLVMLGLGLLLAWIQVVYAGLKRYRDRLIENGPTHP